MKVTLLFVFGLLFSACLAYVSVHVFYLSQPTGLTNERLRGSSIQQIEAPTANATIGAFLEGFVWGIQAKQNVAGECYVAFDTFRLRINQMLSAMIIAWRPSNFFNFVDALRIAIIAQADMQQYVQIFS